MPTQWTFDLDLTTDLADGYRYDVLHAVTCRFFEQPDSDHDAEHKPFAVRLTSPTPARSTLTLSWLSDDPAPATVIPTTFQLGPNHTNVTGLHMRKTPLADLGASPTGSRVTYRVLSPTKFRHHGRDYPLPDPYLTYNSLARRYRALSPDNVTDDTAREVARSVVVYSHDIRTQPFTWHDATSAGFIGSVTFGLPRACTPAARSLFATLNDFATIAGIGHGTTHGLGAVTTDTLNPNGT
jgi:CRISPR-associated endoribonuclease Cas6